MIQQIVMMIMIYIYLHKYILNKFICNIYNLQKPGMYYANPPKLAKSPEEV